MEGVKEDCLKTKPVRLVLAKDNVPDGNERDSEAASTGSLPPGEALRCRSVGMLPEMKSLMADPQCLENPTCDSRSEMREVPKARTTLPLDL